VTVTLMIKFKLTRKAARLSTQSRVITVTVPVSVTGSGITGMMSQPED
jgi:hypothetical protein